MPRRSGSSRRSNSCGQLKLSGRGGEKQSSVIQRRGPTEYLLDVSEVRHAFIRFSDFTLGSLQALLDKEEFKVDWGDDDHPYQIVIQTASGPAAFQICENESNFPEGERIEVDHLLVRRSAPYFSRNT